MSTSVAPDRSSAFVRFASPVALLALMWAIQLLDAILPGSFTGFGLRSWDLGSLQGLVLGPLLHSGWPHLIGNTLPFLVLGCLVAVEGAGRFWLVTAATALVGGAGTWLLNTPGTLTVGASVLVFGYFAYIVVRVFSPQPIAHRVAYALIAFIVIVLYGGSVFTGIFGASAGVSWQAHVFGAIGGAIAALTGLRQRKDRPA
ncbi:membrane protein [Microbacterium sp. CH12i]|uniref:rhomboid family intramembrane serine protease n=1 Tax=Microbacterium sp. CH12i TaxID=1479651 RepID=UPI0004613AF8|nr:rhomboid family intramembrane serine protease [Microbacterium sp. CH12i]KDA06122.1 membrane protein [Microbacterium sp. CH12i]